MAKPSGGRSRVVGDLPHNLELTADRVVGHRGQGTFPDRRGCGGLGLSVVRLDGVLLLRQHGSG